MKITYTDNYGRKRTMEIPDDTTQEVLAFLDESERKQEALRRTDNNHKEKKELTEEELFHRSIYKPLLGKLHHPFHKGFSTCGLYNAEK